MVIRINPEHDIRSLKHALNIYDNELLGKQILSFLIFDYIELWGKVILLNPFSIMSANNLSYEWWSSVIRINPGHHIRSVKHALNIYYNGLLGKESLKFDCNFCPLNIIRINRNNPSKWTYPDLDSSNRTVPHLEKVLIPTFHQLTELSEDESWTSDHPSDINKGNSNYEGLSSSTP